MGFMASILKLRKIALEPEEPACSKGSVSSSFVCVKLSSTIHIREVTTATQLKIRTLALNPSPPGPSHYTPSNSHTARNYSLRKPLSPRSL